MQNYEGSTKPKRFHGFYYFPWVGRELEDKLLD
jgi:hypothetical protein